MELTVVGLIVWVVLGVGLQWGFFLAGWFAFLYSIAVEKLGPFVLAVACGALSLGWAILWISQAVSHIITISEGFAA